jgi:hypothetical protein
MYHSAGVARYVSVALLFRSKKNTKKGGAKLEVDEKLVARKLKAEKIKKF